MKRIQHVLVTIFTMLGFIAPISTEANQYITIEEETPIILKHDIELQQEKAFNLNEIHEANETALYHYSHRSHRSHYSHSSHRSHYSHYSSRY